MGVIWSTGYPPGQGIDNKLSLELCEYEIQTIYFFKVDTEEVLVNTLAGWVPTFSLGLACEIYCTVLFINRIASVTEDGANFGAGNKIGNEVDIYRDVA